MNDNIDSGEQNRTPEATLENVGLNEVSRLVQFAKEDALGTVGAEVDFGICYVTVYYADYHGVATVEYVAGGGTDTAFMGDLSDVAPAVARAVRHSDGAEVVRDDFGVLDEAEQAGDRR